MGEYLEIVCSARERPLLSLSYSHYFSHSFFARAYHYEILDISSSGIKNRNMSNMIKFGIRIFTTTHSKHVVPYILLPPRHQRSCFHTSWIFNVKGKELLMPSLSPTMETGTIVKWFKKEGELINPGDAIADIETDKAVMTLDFEDESILAKIIIGEGKKANVGEIIALTVEVDEDWKSVEYSQKDTAVSSESISKETTPSSTITVDKGFGASNIPLANEHEKPTDADKSSVDKTLGNKQVYGLAVKRLLEEYDINSGSIKGSGRPNRLLKEDVLAYIQSKSLQKVAPKAVAAKSTPISKMPSKAITLPIKPSTFIDIPISNIRAIIAKRLIESKTSIPHAYASIDINISKLEEIRKKFKASNNKISINDFIVKAVGHVLLECPEVNSLYKNGEVIRQTKVDVSIAVSTPTGLITPIVFNTATKTLDEISNDIKVLSRKAREGKLQPQEFQGGTFSISNLGMFGINNFSAIINPPQNAILAVGGSRAVFDLSTNRNLVMNVTLSYNRGAIDDKRAANFLQLLQALLQDPSVLVAGRTISDSK
ncbi:PREDICTED: dihydrolipoyllysine-residue acetyltransferase component of pyruvate dehydrogenase complex, mitochondrial-like [Ceratosolen solmsi marchali]|uniref:Dihydrolipoamide acetyltransferase component of pyruvate dehydrogenase complex n=1 Tax=Ceratosolen solmsi marchali TaxID=326594 RepID=A0AAJ6YNF0_9HYME|nr:PREDICTED: dihydrolipoyllysine-residue acetyltransferase component of pyruvate dehydrogenase complex, mitochondrial-like [Ceratosolen solmsi marchali]